MKKSYRVIESVFAMIVVMLGAAILISMLLWLVQNIEVTVLAFAVVVAAAAAENRLHRRRLEKLVAKALDDAKE